MAVLRTSDRWPHFSVVWGKLASPRIAGLGKKTSYLDPSPCQSLGKLRCIVQGRAGVLGAVQQQHRGHEVGILGSVHHIGGGQCLQLSFPLEAHDAVEQGVVQTPLVEVLPQICAVVHAGDSDQPLDLGGVPLGGATKDMLPPSGNLSLCSDNHHEASSAPKAWQMS